MLFRSLRGHPDLSRQPILTIMFASSLFTVPETAAGISPFAGSSFSASFSNFVCATRLFILYRKTLGAPILPEVTYAELNTALNLRRSAIGPSVYNLRG